MTLILPSANVSFSMGSNVAPSDPLMGKSLDDMIKDRRKEQAKTSKRGPKKVENADRAVATSRAKRQAAINARRGLSESKKATPMEIEKEVYREARKTASAKERKQQKAAGGRLPPDSSARRQRKKAEAKKQTAPKTPSKKAFKAAVSAMKEKGFDVPDGMQVVITLAPKDSPKTPAKQTGTQNNNKKGGKGNKSDGNDKKNSPQNNSGNKNNGGGRRKK